MQKQNWSNLSELIWHQKELQIKIFLKSPNKSHWKSAQLEKKIDSIKPDLNIWNLCSQGCESINLSTHNFVWLKEYQEREMARQDW